MIENFKLLAEAISSIKDSLKIYEVSDLENVQDQENYYGMALCYF